MPALTTTNATILVTGANGFIAAWIVGDLLKKGYAVRAAVRTKAKGNHLLDIYKEFGDKLEIVAVGDIGADGAFDDAVKGVNGIIHTASPVHLTAVEPKEIIDPAVQGMVGILKSALKYGSSVQRVVLTSSCTAILDFSTEPRTISEADWNDGVVKECEEKGVDASPLAKYSASKTLAEKAAWEFYEKHKAEVKWDIVVINPPSNPQPQPAAHEVPTVDHLNPSCRILYGAIVKGEFPGGSSPLDNPGHGWADPRDVSEALIRSLSVPEAGAACLSALGISLIETFTVDAANSLSPSPYPAPVPKGIPGGQVKRALTLVTDKEKKILGIKFRTLADLARDVLEDYARRGW